MPVNFSAIFPIPANFTRPLSALVNIPRISPILVPNNFNKVLIIANGIPISGSFASIGTARVDPRTNINFCQKPSDPFVKASHHDDANPFVTDHKLEKNVLVDDINISPNAAPKVLNGSFIKFSIGFRKVSGKLLSIVLPMDLKLSSRVFLTFSGNKYHAILAPTRVTNNNLKTVAILLNTFFKIPAIFVKLKTLSALVHTSPPPSFFLLPCTLANNPVILFQTDS